MSVEARAIEGGRKKEERKEALTVGLNSDRINHDGWILGGGEGYVVPGGVCGRGWRESLEIAGKWWGGWRAKMSGVDPKGCRVTDGDDGSKGLQHRKEGGAGQDGHFALFGGRGSALGYLFPFFRSSACARQANIPATCGASDGS